MMHVRDQIVAAIVGALKANPVFENRVFAETPGDWDERTYPIAVVVSGPTAIRPIADLDGYRVRRRTQEIAVSFGVREYDGEDPIATLSALATDVEDAVLAVEDAGIVEAIEAKSVSPVLDHRDAHGGISASMIVFDAEYYTQHGNSGAFVSGN